MTERNGILSAGAFAIDYIKKVDSIPASGAVSRIQMEQVSNGGHAYNVLVNLARLGGRFKLKALGWIGQDMDGRAILDDCMGHHIDTEWLHISKADHTSYNDVMVCPDTVERSILTRMGAHARLSPKDFKAENCAAKFLYLGPVLGLGDLDTPHRLSGTRAAELLRLAQKAGIWTAISTLPAKGTREMLDAALRFTDYLFLTEADLAMLSDTRFRFNTSLQHDAIEVAAREMLDKGVHKAVFLKFSEGALCIPRKGARTFVPGAHLPMTRMLSSGGVDSAFVAGVLYGLHEQLPVPEALKIGLGASAACSMDLTTSGGVRSVAKCLNLYEQYQGTLVRAFCV